KNNLDITRRPAFRLDHARDNPADEKETSSSARRAKKQTVAIHSSTLYTTVTAATRLSALSTPPNHPTFLHYRSISPTPTGLSYCEETVHATHPAHSGYCIFRTVA